MLDRIPQNRILVYIMVLALFPFFFSVMNFMTKKKSLTNLDGMLEQVQQKALLQQKKQATNLMIRNHYHNADRFYIDKHLETLTFLEPEVEGLQRIMSHKNFTGDPLIKRRFEFLTGPGNSLVFTEGFVQTSPTFQETMETLVHPVEVDIANIQEILAKVEGIDIGPYKPGPNRPQLIILYFKVEKKKTNEENEVFLLNIKLLKREYT